MKALQVLAELYTSSHIGHQRRVSWGNGTEPGEFQEMGKRINGWQALQGRIHSFIQHSTHINGVSTTCQRIQQEKTQSLSPGRPQYTEMQRQQKYNYNTV